MRSCPHEVDCVAFELVDQQEVATDVAFAMVGPVAFEGVVEPFGTQRALVGDEQQHRLFQPLHVVAA